jgi:hypothetical protein
MTTTSAEGSEAIGQPSGAPQGPLARVRALLGRVPHLNVTLSAFSTIMGLITGVSSIVGALVAIPGYFQPAPGRGQVMAVVVDAKTDKAVSNATVEILMPNNALVTTASSSYLGKASSTLEEGQYRIRVTHPKFGAETRNVQVVSGQSTEVRLRLRSGASAPLREAERVVGKGVSAIRRLFGN